MMRILTTRFFSYVIAKYERKYNKEFMDFLDIGNLSMAKILLLIQMGNNDCSEEDAGKKADNFLADENNSVIDLYLQLMTELNADTHILKGTGITIEGLKESFYGKINDSANNISIEKEASTDAAKIEQFPVKADDIEPTVAKVDVNGFVPVD